MPLLAKTNQNELISIINFDNPKEQIKDDIFCPECSGKMHIVQGHKRINHFRHNQSESCAYGKETPMHIFLKYHYCKNLLPKKYPPESFDIYPERTLPTKKRRPDITIINKHNGQESYYEIQCSYISLGDLRKRTNDLEEMNPYEIVWVFTLPSNFELQVEWCLTQIGYCHKVKRGMVGNNEIYSIYEAYFENKISQVNANDIKDYD